MADSETKTARRSPFADTWVAEDSGRIGHQGPGITLRDLRDFSIVRVHTEAGPVEMSQQFGLNGWPEAGRARDGSDPNGSGALSGSVRAIWGGPTHITLTAPDSHGLHHKIHTLALEPKPRTVDQSHGHAILRISGRNARDLLAKGTGIDLHPKVFGEDHVAHTTLFHHAVTLDRRRGSATYDVHVMRGFAADLLHRIKDHAAEYGVRMDRG